jgi:SAM-dependent methyltransferase
VNPLSDAAAYGDACADFYDQIYGPVPRVVVERLHTLVGSGRSLELGSATGRVALALRKAGHLRYVGVEASQAMVDALRAKPACLELDIVLGDFAECALPGKFDLIFALVGTFHLLPSLQRQAAAFKHLAAHMMPGGTLLLECFGVSALDHIDQLQQVTHRVDTPAGARDYPVRVFLSTPSELDAMARAAGLHLVERWSGWHMQAYAAGVQHISLYRRGKTKQI